MHPRASALGVADYVIRHAAPGQHVLDLGCGSGIVGGTILLHRPDLRVSFADKYEYALEETVQNLRRNGLEAHQVRLADMAQPQSGFDTIDLLVSNPPFQENAPDDPVRFFAPQESMGVPAGAPWWFFYDQILTHYNAGLFIFHTGRRCSGRLHALARGHGKRVKVKEKTVHHLLPANS